MIVTVVLDRQNAQYTNLDVITGRVVVRNPSNTALNAIVVKLEGESRTRLFARGPHPGDKEKAMTEAHKVGRYLDVLG